MRSNKSWCFLRDNQKLRAVVERRLKELGLKGKALTEFTSIPAWKISDWKTKGNRGLTQFQFMTLCSRLGINIDIQIEYNERILL
jgi:hypothetical protein